MIVVSALSLIIGTACISLAAVDLSEGYRGWIVGAFFGVANLIAFVIGLHTWN